MLAPAFSNEIRDKVDERTCSMMTLYERITVELLSATDSMTEHLLFPPPNDIREAHNNYIRAILASTAAKHVSLTTSLIEAVNKTNMTS